MLEASSEDEANQAIGVVGAGAMGLPIIRRLIHCNVGPVLVFDKSHAAAARARAAGAVVAPNPAALAERCRLVLMVLPSVDASWETLNGVEGLLSATMRPKAIVEMSTIGPEKMRTLSAACTAAGVDLVDCPISGGVEPAGAGQLMAMAAGAEPALASFMPVLKQLASRIFVVGDSPGQAQAMKLVENILTGAVMVLCAEAMALGAREGLEPAKMVEILNAGSGRSSASQDKIPRAVLTGSLDYGCRTAIIYKDLDLAASHAAAMGIEVPVTAAVRNAWARVMDAGYADADFTNLFKLTEQQARVRLVGTGSTPSGRSDVRRSLPVGEIGKPS